MQKKYSRLFIFLAIGLAIALLIWYFSRPKPIEVAVSTIGTGTVEEVVTNTRAGTVNACRRARLAPALGGQIAKLPVREGSLVKANDILLEMWNDDVNAQLLLAKQEAKAALGRAKQACVQADVATREAKRQAQLLKQKLTSEEAADRAQGDAEAQRAACDAANDSAKVSGVQIDVVQVALDRTILRAPFDGIVAEVNGEVGEFITPSPVGIPTLPAVDLIDNTCIYVKAPIDEVDAPAIKPAMPVRITLDAFKDYPFPGKVRRIAPYVLDREKQARTVDIEVDFNNIIGRQDLLPGYSADVEVILQVKDNTLRIPTEAIFEEQYVYAYLEDSSRVEKRKITTGISNWIYTEVLSGLQIGDRVLTSVNVEGLTDGALVSLKPAATSNL